MQYLETQAATDIIYTQRIIPYTPLPILSIKRYNTTPITRAIPHPTPTRTILTTTHRASISHEKSLDVIRYSPKPTTATTWLLLFNVFRFLNKSIVSTKFCSSTMYHIFNQPLNDCKQAPLPIASWIMYDCKVISSNVKFWYKIHARTMN